MLQRALVLLRYNKSAGHRWSAIPKPPPPHTDRLYGTHSVLNALRVIAGGQGEAQADVEAGTMGSGASPLVTDETTQALVKTMIGTKTASMASPSSGHPHRPYVNCLYIRDFSLEIAGKGRGGSQHKDKRDGASTGPTPSETKVIPRQYSALHRIVALAKDAQVPVRFVPRSELWQLCGERRNQNVVLEVASFTPTQIADASGILAGSFFRHEDSPPSASNMHDANDSLVILYLDRILDPTNVGSILRTSFFFGVDHVILSSDSASCTPAVARTSTGFLEFMHVWRSSVPTPTFLSNTRASFEAKVAAETTPLHAARLDIIGSTAHRPKPHTAKAPAVAAAAAASTTAATVTGGRRVQLVVLGNEDAGLSEAVLEQCSHLLHIHSPRQARLQAQRVQEKQALFATQAEESEEIVEASAAREEKGSPRTPQGGKPARTMSAVQKRELALQKLRRLQRSEVSLNVNTACAALLSSVVGDGAGGTQALVQVVPRHSSTSTFTVTTAEHADDEGAGTG